MDVLIPISREQMRLYANLPHHIRTLLQRCINDVFQAMIGGKTQCLLDVSRYLNVNVEMGCSQYTQTPAFGASKFIPLLQLKFPDCTIEYLQDHWLDVDATTRRKVTGIRIDWS